MDGSKLKVGVIGSKIWVNYFKQAFENDPKIDVLVLNQSLQRCTSKVKNLDVLYLIFGWFDFIHFASFISCTIRHIPIVIHWIGTDVWRMTNPNEMEGKMRLKRYLQLYSMKVNGHCTHIAGAPWLAEELGSLGIEAKFCPTIYGMLDSDNAPVYRLPNKMAAFSYIPLGREDFYGESLVLSAARSNPDILFTVISNDQSRQPVDLPNVKYYGWLTAKEMEEVMRASTCCMRLTKHDGLAGTIMEAIMRGRYGIFSYSHPYVHKALNNDEIDMALADIRSKDKPNYEGAEFVRNHYSRQITKEHLKKILVSAYYDKD